MFRHPHRLLRLLVGGCLVAALGGATAAPVAASDRHRHDQDNRYQQINLLSDQQGAAQHVDPNLVNAWGLALSPTSPLWVSNNGTSTSTLYSGTATDGSPATALPLVVKIPGGGSPTGVVFNGGPNFALSTDNKTGPARFIFAGENGEIFGWNPTGDPTAATQTASTPDAVYKGLALLTADSKQFLLAANFHDNRIDVYDSAFARVPTRHAFRSVGIPRGYAPFDVAVFGDRVLVSYAKQDADRHDDVAGAGHGFINTFDLHGRFLMRFATRGVLNSPWGMAVAPQHFGSFSGDLLVGNFGDGRIHAFNLRSGHRVGTLDGADGKPLQIDGLWGLLSGNGVAGQTSDLWFSAGPGGESHGLLGILRATDPD